MAPLAEQEGLKIELATDVPYRGSFLCQRPDGPGVVILGQAVPVMSNDHAGSPTDVSFQRLALKCYELIDEGSMDRKVAMAHLLLARLGFVDAVDDEHGQNQAVLSNIACCMIWRSTSSVMCPPDLNNGRPR